MLKKITLTLNFTLLFFSVFAQVGIGTLNPDESSILDLVSSDKGVLMPRMTTAERESINNPADGLYIYDTDESRFFFFSEKNSGWEKVGTQNDIESRENPGKSTGKVKNVIFMIGDGMGPAQIQAAFTTNFDHLNMTTFPYTGIVRTYSADAKTTDSAASATAMSCGVKTKNGYLGLDPNGNRLTSIITNAKRNGLSTGIVVTQTVTHATPAAFYAFQTDRYNYTAIAADFALSNTVDVCIGGGKQYFNATDISNLIYNNYNVVYNLNDVTSDKDKVVALLADDGMPTVWGGRGEMLSVATAKALDILKKNDKGFFLMIEGSYIDSGGHSKDVNYAIRELLDFDRAVSVAKSFAEADGNTLVIVTADHETGGLIVYGKENMETYYTNKLDGKHTCVPVFSFAYGPGGENFVGFFDNIDFKPRMEKLLNFQ